MIPKPNLLLLFSEKDFNASKYTILESKQSVDVIYAQKSRIISSKVLELILQLPYNQLSANVFFVSVNIVLKFFFLGGFFIIQNINLFSTIKLVLALVFARRAGDVKRENIILGGIHRFFFVFSRVAFDRFSKKNRNTLSFSPCVGKESKIQSSTNRKLVFHLNI